MTVSDRRIHAVPTAEPERYVTRAELSGRGPRVKVILRRFEHGMPATAAGATDDSIPGKVTVDEVLDEIQRNGAVAS